MKVLVSGVLSVVGDSVGMTGRDYKGGDRIRICNFNFCWLRFLDSVSSLLRFRFLGESRFFRFFFVVRFILVFRWLICGV